MQAIKIVPSFVRHNELNVWWRFGYRIEGNSMAVDPICNMKVAESQAKYTSTHNGSKYYFCCGACKQEFDKNPSKYAK